MDSKDALKILNLDAGVSLDGAKKAYRSLAKKYHPDVAGNDSIQQKNAEKRMKEINLAFRALAPQLNSTKKQKASEPIHAEPESGKTTSEFDSAEPEPRPPMSSSEQTAPGNFSWAKIFEGFSWFFEKKSPKKTPSKKKQGRAVRENRFSSGNPRKKDHPRHFNEVFKSVHPAGLKKTNAPPRKRKKIQTSDTSYRGYQAYMDLKQKMKSGRPVRRRDMSVGRVEKVEPIKPVTRVEK